MYIRRSYSYRIHRVFSSLYQPAYSSHSTYQVGSVALAARTMLLTLQRRITPLQPPGRPACSATGCHTLNPLLLWSNLYSSS